MIAGKFANASGSVKVPDVKLQQYFSKRPIKISLSGKLRPKVRP
jgi:hypothetical protein